MGGLRQSTENGERVWRIEDRFTIGRDPQNDLVLSDHVVSSRHATIEERSGEYVLVDHDSRNGTYVQRGSGEPIRVRSSYSLTNGDAIRVGSSRLIFDKSIAAPPLADSNTATPPELTVAAPTSAFPPTEHG